MTEKPASVNSTRERHEPYAVLLLVLLLCTDLVFITVHILYSLTTFFDNPLLSLDRELGYPELFQYIKWFWVIILLLYMTVSTRSLRYAAWVLLFAFLLADDVFMLHEVWGSRLARLFTESFLTGLRKQDIGELLVSALVTLALLIPVWLSYRKGSSYFRRISRDLFLLLVVVFFFGVILDPVHAAFRSHPVTGFILGVAEDGGEMVAASLIVWYVYLRCVQGEHTGISLAEAVIQFFKWKKG